VAGAVGATLVCAEEAEWEGMPEEGRLSRCSHEIQKYLLDPRLIRSEGGRLAPRLVAG
jgi:hypothetical protein